jgi:aldehyde:ferredoxin oxidoreductase
MPAGPSKGQVVNLDLMLDEYYEARGWDKESGFPTRQKLEQLELKAVADELDGIGKGAQE